RFAPSVMPRTQGEWSDSLRAALTAAVRRQLMSDVPIGSLLSGGVDSTAITRIMTEALPQPPTAFAVGFSNNPAFDALTPARQAAEALGVRLCDVSIAEADYLAEWPRQVAALGEPIANSSA